MDRDRLRELFHESDPQRPAARGIHPVDVVELGLGQLHGDRVGQDACRCLPDQPGVKIRLVREVVVDRHAPGRLLRADALADTVALGEGHAEREHHAK